MYLGVLVVLFAPALSNSLSAQSFQRWSVHPTPILTIGSEAADGPSEFTNIVGAFHLSDGSLVVADGGTRELRVFDGAGRYLRKLARRGAGPGELPDLDDLFAVGDTLIAASGRESLHIFAPSGSVLHVFSPPSLLPLVHNPPVGVWSSSEFIYPASRSLNLDTLWLLRLSTTSAVPRVAATIHRPHFYSVTAGAPPSQPVGFAPRILVATSGERLCLAWTANYDIVCQDSSGREIVRITRRHRVQPVTNTARRAFKKMVAGIRDDGSHRYQGALAEHRKRAADAAKFATNLPAISQLMFSRTGELWVRDYIMQDGLEGSRWRHNHSPSSWSVYDRSGRLVATVSLPPRFAPSELGRDYVLGVSADENDVQRVTKWRIQAAK